MAIETLILAADGNGWRKKGYIITEKYYDDDNPIVWTSEEGLPTFIRVKIDSPTLTLAQAQAYREQWTLDYTWDVQVHNTSLDGYRVLIYATPVNASGVGQITWAKCSSFLIPMEVQFVSEGASGVTVDYGIYQTVTSTWMWGGDVTGVVFDEISYDSGTGIHRVEADYSAAGFTIEKVERAVTARGGSIVSHAASVITFDINRTSVNSAMKQAFDVEAELKKEERRFYVDGTYVDQVVAGTYPGQVGGAGFDTRSKSEFLALINDRIDE